MRNRGVCYLFLVNFNELFIGTIFRDNRRLFVCPLNTKDSLKDLHLHFLVLFQVKKEMQMSLMLQRGSSLHTGVKNDLVALVIDSVQTDKCIDSDCDVSLACDVQMYIA